MDLRAEAAKLAHAILDAEPATMEPVDVAYANLVHLVARITGPAAPPTVAPAREAAERWLSEIAFPQTGGTGLIRDSLTELLAERDRASRSPGLDLAVAREALAELRGKIVEASVVETARLLDRAMMALGATEALRGEGPSPRDK